MQSGKVIHVMLEIEMEQNKRKKALDTVYIHLIFWQSFEQNNYLIYLNFVGNVKIQEEERITS